MSQTIVITGANRGIGLELARAWQERGDRVIAVCRHASQELDALKLQVIDGIDVTRPEALTQLHDALADTRIDMLYNNAGILRQDNLEAVPAQALREQFEVNSMAPLLLTLALLDRLARPGKVGLMTSRMGSMAENTSGGYYGYRMSKAALNAAGKSLALDLAPQQIAVALLHPGYVKTDMTGHNGQFSARESARLLVQRMDELTLENSGSFWHADGSLLPW